MLISQSLATLATSAGKALFRNPRALPAFICRSASSASSTRWKSRQGSDSFTRDARVAGLKSRAAFKLLEIDQKHRIFRSGDTVVDLGYAPGSWSQVAVSRCAPGGRVIGIDVIPAQPPRGASSIQGDFLSPEVREEVRNFVRDAGRGRPGVLAVGENTLTTNAQGILQVNATTDDVDYNTSGEQETRLHDETRPRTRRQLDDQAGRVVDVVLSDMSAPWPLTSGMWIKSVSNPYFRMMNTTGVAFKDHVGSMDLCMAALTFCYDTLRTGGHFLCKFYQGGEDKAFEMQLKRLFERVHREKPASSRKDSKEGYFIALRRKSDVDRAAVFSDQT